MKIKNPKLEKVAMAPDQYPAPDLKEIALAGRSNVGKSSFVNSMVARKNLARTSSQPGKTQTINFYNIDGLFRLVDLPGYGYAKASHQARDTWAQAINTYLETRTNLEEILLVVDYRHPPTDLDVIMYDYIVSMGYRGLVLATKADKVKQSTRHKNLKSIKEKLKIQDKSQIIIYSSQDTKYRDQAWARLEDLIKN